MIQSRREERRVMPEEVIDYLKQNRHKLLQRLEQFLTIPSISTDSTYNTDVKKAAQFVSNYLEEIHFHVEQIDTKGHPLIYASYDQAGENAPTVLFYGHYDVQPVDPMEEWDSDPFQPEIRNGRIY